jgi:hypothetical protein
MKTILKHSNHLLFALALGAMMLSGCGCFTPTPDPLAGWQKNFGEIDQSIVNDYQNYIQNLSPTEKRNVRSIHFFEDRTGQNAIEIILGINGRYWRHILIYDKGDKRVQTIKYATGYYAS